MSAFEPGRHVVLTLPKLGRLPARVEEAGDGRLTLVLFVRPGTPIPWLDSDAAEIECAGERGVYRAAGRVAAEGGGRDARLHVEVAGDPQLVQRRDFVRVDALVPITVRVGAMDAAPVETYATNLSGGGFLVAGPATLEVGDRIWFSMRLPDGRPPLEGWARVVRETERGFKGCTLYDIAEHERELIVRFTFDRQRDQLRKGGRA